MTKMSEEKSSESLTAALAPGLLWCAGMDAELPTLVPGAEECLGAMRDVELLTYCSPTNGKINCPTAWWTDGGLAAFFALPDFGGITPPGYVGGKEIVSCTFWEAVQDEWWHDSIIRVNWRHNVWKPPSGLMMALMYDVRGWTCGGDAMTDAQNGRVGGRKNYCNSRGGLRSSKWLAKPAMPRSNASGSFAGRSSTFGTRTTTCP